MHFALKLEILKIESWQKLPSIHFLKHLSGRWRCFFIRKTMPSGGKLQAQAYTSKLLQTLTFKISKVYVMIVLILKSKKEWQFKIKFDSSVKNLWPSNVNSFCCKDVMFWAHSFPQILKFFYFCLACLLEKLAGILRFMEDQVFWGHGQRF